MKKFRGIALLLSLSIILSSITGCGAKDSQALGVSPLDDNYRTAYEIFVYSFYDSDGDKIGDLNGVKEKLDYIKDLGFNEIWLMPISPSPTYHKYDVTDYFNIDEQYGTLDDFDALITACHDMGINVILDLVINHTSSEHPWFKEASEYMKTISDESEIDLSICPYAGYYNFTKSGASGYEKLEGSDWYYEARFWSGMPDLNLDNDAVKEEIKEITNFWLSRGVDGFRLDATTSYYTGNDKATIDFLTWFNDMVKEQKEDAYIVGEAWTNMTIYSQYYKSGASFFNFDFAGDKGIIANTVGKKASAASFATKLKECEDLLSSYNENYIDAPFYTNHDMSRSCGYYPGEGGDNKVKLAAALNLLMGGNVFVYYGEELGMKGSGKDENKRAPMYWSDSASAGMCAGPADMDSFTQKYPSLEEQKDDPNSIYNYFKNAIALRNMFPVIARGTTTPVAELSDDDICCFIRSISEEKAISFAGTLDKFGPTSLLIIINTSDAVKEVSLTANTDAATYKTIAYNLDTGTDKAVFTDKKKTTISLPAYSIVVLAN